MSAPWDSHITGCVASARRTGWSRPRVARSAGVADDDRVDLNRLVGRELGDRAAAERIEDALPHAPQRIADVALGVLVARAFVGRAGGDGDRTVDRFDDVGHGNLL